MNSTVWIWSVVAVLLFWGVGAYNRLMRLRALVIAAFAPLQLQYGQYLELVQKNFGHEPGDQGLNKWEGMLSAAQQFESSLKAASAHPLDSLVMRALETAYAVLLDTWAKACGEPQDLAGELLPAVLQKQWSDISQHSDHAKEEYDKRVLDYNQSIQQFPANMLAWLFRFKPSYGRQEDER